MAKIKIFTLMLLVFCLFVHIPNCYAQKSKTHKHKIEFSTTDRFILAGDLYIASEKSKKPLVVMIHSFSLNALRWSDLALTLRQRGYNVLAMDLRGHGRSVYDEDLKLKSRFKFTSKDWGMLPKDITQSIAYVKANYPDINCNDVILVGADIGANAAVLAGHSMDKQPEKIILISPMSDFKGLYIPIKLADFLSTKFMFLVSSTDKTSCLELDKLIRFVQTVPVIKKYPQGGAGNQLLKINPEAKIDILNFIGN